MKVQIEKQRFEQNWNEVYLDGRYKATVGLIEYSTESPRIEFSNKWKFVMRETSYHSLPNELGFNWYDYDNDELEQFEAICENYYVFWIDMYEHWWITFSFHWEGMQCRFDTSSWIGFIAVPKVYNEYDYNEINCTRYKVEDWEKYNPNELSYREAKEIASQELRCYNQWCNWEIYEYTVEKLVKWTSEDWKEKVEYEVIDCCSGYYSEEQCKDEAVSIIDYESRK